MSLIIRYSDRRLQNTRNYSNVFVLIKLPEILSWSSNDSKALAECGSFKRNKALECGLLCWLCKAAYHQPGPLGSGQSKPLVRSAWTEVCKEFWKFCAGYQTLNLLKSGQSFLLLFLSNSSTVVRTSKIQLFSWPTQSAIVHFRNSILRILFFLIPSWFLSWYFLFQSLEPDSKGPMYSSLLWTLKAPGRVSRPPILASNVGTFGYNEIANNVKLWVQRWQPGWLKMLKCCERLHGLLWNVSPQSLYSVNCFFQ